MEEDIKQFQIRLLLWFAALSVATVLVLAFTGDKAARDAALAGQSTPLQECPTTVQQAQATAAVNL